MNILIYDEKLYVLCKRHYGLSVIFIRIKGAFIEKIFLDKANTALVIIDIQERLSSVMKVKETVIQNCLNLIELSKKYGIPSVFTEQYPKGPGQTVEEIRKALPEYKPLEKITSAVAKNSHF